MSLVKFWGLILLISYLGNGLEFLIAKKISHLAIIWDIVCLKKFGVLPKRSAADIVPSVAHEIEKAKIQG